jgi:hypothetical protein
MNNVEIIIKKFIKNQESINDTFNPNQDSIRFDKAVDPIYRMYGFYIQNRSQFKPLIPEIVNKVAQKLDTKIDQNFINTKKTQYSLIFILDFFKAQYKSLYEEYIKLNQHKIVWPKEGYPCVECAKKTTEQMGIRIMCEICFTTLRVVCFDCMGDDKSTFNMEELARPGTYGINTINLECSSCTSQNKYET